MEMSCGSASAALQTRGGRWGLRSWSSCSGTLRVRGSSLRWRLGVLLSVGGWLSTLGTVGFGGWGSHRRAGRSAGCLCMATAGVIDDGEPFLGVICGMRLERQLGSAVEGVSNFAARDVLALYTELDAIRGADNAVGKIQGKFGGWVAAEVIVVLELVEVAGDGDDVVARAIALDHSARLPFQRPFNQWLRGPVVLVGKGDVGQRPWRGIWVH